MARRGRGVGRAEQGPGCGSEVWEELGLLWWTPSWERPSSPLPHPSHGSPASPPSPSDQCSSCLPQLRTLQGPVSGTQGRSHTVMFLRLVPDPSRLETGCGEHSPEDWGAGLEQSWDRLSGGALFRVMDHTPALPARSGPASFLPLRDSLERGGLCAAQIRGLSCHCSREQSSGNAGGGEAWDMLL